MITITNVHMHNPDDPMGPSDYELRINGELIVTFTHVRGQGLAKCLRRAAQVVRSQQASSAEKNPQYKDHRFDSRTPREVLLANADYEAHVAEHGLIHACSVREFERKWKLPAKILVNFRANMKRRKTPLPDGGY